MHLPLHKLLIGLSDEHWLRRHPKFPTYKFMVFDPIHQRLRLCVASECYIYPRLCASLYQEILVLKTAKLVPGVWSHILQPPSNSTLDWMRFDFFGKLDITEQWKQYHPVTYRQQQQQLVPSEHRFSNSMVKTFGPLLLIQPQERFYIGHCRDVSLIKPTCTPLALWKTLSVPSAPKASIH